MDLSLERESTVLGSLFQQIIADMKNTSPLWEDFLAKAGKLHASLRAAIQAIAAYLDAFQKIADAATNSRGASKEIGTALTRVCLRHKAVETRLKTFTSAIMDCMVLPLQDKVEDWKRQVAIIDKEHAKEYKRCRTELKKRSSDTLRLQKKARKGQSDTIQSLVDSHMQDVTLRRAELEEVEKKSLRAAMIEERMRYCTFVHMLQPVVKEECEVMSEMGHLQEAMLSIATVTKDPNALPQSSEELISDAKSTINIYPESPGGNSGSQGCSNSLGSRKSSVCSISSMNSSGSSGSPSHHHYPRSLSQLIPPTIRLKPGESSDSGFCSSPALTSQVSTATSQSHAVSTWPPHSQDAVQTADRPHTISSAYEKGHQRPALTVYTFQNPETIIESSASPKSPANIVGRPPLPVRCSSLERPLSSNARNNNANLMTRQCPSPIPAHITKELPQHQTQLQQPTYVNMSELATMAALKMSQQPVPPAKPVKQNHQMNLQHQQSTDSHSSVTSQVSSSESSIGIGNGHQSNPLHSQPSTESGEGPTPTPSSGASTPLNITTPQLTNNSPSTPVSGCAFSNSPVAPDVLKITETDNTNNPGAPVNDNNHPTEREEIARGSVLQKTSMFEKQAAAASIAPAAPLSSGRSSHSISSGESIYSTRKDEFEKDPDQIYEDSIQELNNLIGELDSFQREHEMHIPFGRKSGALVSNSNGHGTDADSDKISIGSFNYSTQSTSASDAKNAYSDSELSRYVSETSSMGFENPTFAHLNQSVDSPLTSEMQHPGDNDSGSVVMIYDHSLPLPPDVDFLRQNSEIVVLRCKGPQTPQTTAVASGESVVPKQRLSSFRNELMQRESTPVTTPTKSDQGTPNEKRNDGNLLSKSHLNRFDENTSINSLAKNHSNISNNDNNNNISPVLNKDFKLNLDEKLRSKQIPIACSPAFISPHAQPSSSLSQSSSLSSSIALAATSLKPTILPRPASLSGCASRIARRASVNSAKPPPPIRRSSSVTPNHNLSTPNSPNLVQQNVMNNSADCLPPPPAYLLDKQSQNSSLKVSETVKALAAIRHTPASPSAIRRAQNMTNQHPPQPQTPQTPVVQSQSPSSHLTHGKCTPHIQTQQHQSTPPALPPPNTQKYPKTPPSGGQDPSYRTANSNSPGIYAQPKQVSNMSSFRTSSPITAQQPNPVQPQFHQPPPAQPKTNPNLIAQLNARLHKQPEYGVYQQQTQPLYGSTPNSPHHHTNYHQQQDQIYSRDSERYYQNQQQSHYDGNDFSSVSCRNISSSSYSSSLYQYSNQKTPSFPSSTTANQAPNSHNHHHLHQHPNPPHHNQREHHSCPPPVENPPPPPVVVHATPTSATLPKKPARMAGSISTHSFTMPKNPQLQNYLQHHQQQAKLIYQQGHQRQLAKQPPVPARHSSIQQKIFVSTNPFITTTAVHYSNSSPSSPSGYGGSFGGGGGGFANSCMKSSQSQYAANTNFSPGSIDKSGSMRTKSKAEFLENLNAKLAKQGLSGKAFAVRNLINSKALHFKSLNALPRPSRQYRSAEAEPDPRLCHESLMDQIKRGAPLKRNRTINDRSAPKIH